MEKTVIVLTFLLACGMSMPRRALDCRSYSCLSKPQLPVCGTDGQTYSTLCDMNEENKRRMCFMGHYNMITKVHDGPCDPTTTVDPLIQG